MEDGHNFFISLASRQLVLQFYFYLFPHLPEGLLLMACHDLNAELNIYVVILEIGLRWQQAPKIFQMDLFLVTETRQC